jgi:diguanylate cyclase (GGDEF)-like protein
MSTEAQRENVASVKPNGRDGTARIQPLEAPRSERSVHVLVAGENDYYKRVVDALAAAEITLIDHAATEDELFEKLQREEYDCVIAGQTACGRNSIELRGLIEQRVPNRSAMIMLTDVANQNVILKAFRSGFSDFVTMDHAFGRELLQAVRRSVERNRRTQVLIDENEHLSMLARYDRLTGLPDRSFLEERLATLHSSAKRHTDQFAVLLVDINRFEEILGIHGQAIGDQVLKAFAQKLMSASRASDTIGRFDGAEFLYLMDRDVSYTKVGQACKRLSEALSFCVELDSVSVALSASIGGAVFPSDGKTSDELLNAARQALNTAKANASGHHLPHQAQEGPADTGQTTAAIADPETKDPAAAAAAAGADAAIADERVENRRRERRDRVLFRGRIVLHDGLSTIDCVIRDLSPHGARVTVEDQAVPPRAFSLVILDTGRVFDAIRRWQHGQSIGLEFSAEK